MTNDSPPDLRAWPASSDNPSCYAPHLFDLCFSFYLLLSIFFLPLLLFLVSFPTRRLLILRSTFASTSSPKCSSTRAQARQKTWTRSFSMSPFTRTLGRAYNFCRISGIFYLMRIHEMSRQTAIENIVDAKNFCSIYIYIYVCVCVQVCVIRVSHIFDFETCEFRGYSIRADG